MSIKSFIGIFLFLLSSIANYDIMADSVPIINIHITNSHSIPFFFVYNKKGRNVCTVEPNLVSCKIYNKNIIGNVLNLSWVNLNRINCGVNIILYGRNSDYLFQITSTYNGTSFLPQRWDGHSNIDASLIISSSKCIAY